MTEIRKRKMNDYQAARALTTRFADEFTASLHRPDTATEVAAQLDEVLELLKPTSCPTCGRILPEDWDLAHNEGLGP